MVFGGIRERSSGVHSSGLKMSKFCVGRSMYKEALDIAARGISAN